MEWFELFQLIVKAGAMGAGVWALLDLGGTGDDFPKSAGLCVTLTIISCGTP